MNAPVETGVLRMTLRQARNAARRRMALRVLLDGTVLVATVIAGAALVAGWTRRGDLASTGASIALAVGVLGLLGHAVVHARRRFGTDPRTARAIADHDAPLGVADSPQRASEHRLLRHELLGALELAETLEQEHRGPHAGSPKLAAHYIADVAHRLCADDIDLRRALPGPRWRPRLVVAALVVGSLAIATRGPLADGLGLLLAGVDARPPTPPEPVWSALRLRLHYPEHTGRPVRDVPNPSGALRVPAGTEVEVDLDARLPAEAARVVVTYDAEELSAAPPPEVMPLQSDDEAGMHFTGTFTVRATGTWTVVLLDDRDDSLEESARRSTALPVHEEPDRAPEIELLPLPQDRREVRETDRVEIRLVARDDFGLRSAVLVYQLPDGDSHRLPIKAPKGARRWRRSYDWDISQIPVVERSEVLYWIEVRDNDPGLGLHPLPDPPGKLSRSATQRLLVHDDEAEHASNIVRLRDIRDLAVDLLAARMLSRAFPAATPLPGAPPPPPDVVRAALARDLLHRASQLLARLAEAIDALSLDTLARERDVATLTEVHHRLAKLHAEELALHAKMPPASEVRDPEGTRAALDALADHNEKEVERLEDELIRLDDLVDGQIIERLEALVARLETTQRSMVDLLEQLKAGDQSVRPRIEQLEQRRKEDLRRITEARAMLRKEVDQEFMNLDAFAIVERMKQQPPLTDMLEAGNVDAALEQARGQLGEVQGLRDEVQKRLGEDEETASLSPEERARMKLLRELSKLQDEQTNLRSQTRKLHERWREGVAAQSADEDDRETATTESKALREALDEINDARLGREGRRALDDAKDALEQLDRLSEDERASALDLAEAAEEAARALDRAAEGSQAKEREGKAVRRARDKAKRLQKRLDETLPSPEEVLSPEQAKQLQSLRERQTGLRKQSRTLLDDPVADQLPGPGRKAMRQADQGMERSADQLAQKRPGQAIDPEAQAWQGLQDAIDSLRRGPPPPPPSASGDASTEAERDRSLRDALMEAMREDAPAGFDEPVQRYYEELLR
ncbi:MAG: DUF4175 family protein [Myxococcota bacterium]